MLDMSGINKTKLQFDLEVQHLSVLLEGIEKQGYIGDFNAYYKANSPAKIFIQDQIKVLKEIEAEIANSYKTIIEQRDAISVISYIEFTPTTFFKEQKYKELEETLVKPLRNKMAEYLFQFEQIRFVLLEGIKELNSNYNNKLPELEQQRQNYNEMVDGLKNIEAYPGNYESDLKKLRDLHEIVVKSSKINEQSNNLEAVKLDSASLVKLMTDTEATELEAIKKNIFVIRNKLSNDIRALNFEKEKEKIDTLVENYTTELQKTDTDILIKLQSLKNKIKIINEVTFMFEDLQKASKLEPSANKKSTGSKDLGGTRVADAHEEAKMAREKYLPKTVEYVMDKATQQENFLLTKCKEIIKKQYAIFPLKADVKKMLADANAEQDKDKAIAIFYKLLNDLSNQGVNIDDFRPTNFETETYKKRFTDYITNLIYIQEAGKQFLYLDAMQSYITIPLEINERIVKANDLEQLLELVDYLQQQGIDCGDVIKKAQLDKANALLVLKRDIISQIKKYQLEKYTVRKVNLTLSNEIRKRLETCEGIEQLATLIDFIQKRDPKGAAEIIEHYIMLTDKLKLNFNYEASVQTLYLNDKDALRQFQNILFLNDPQQFKQAKDKFIKQYTEQLANKYAALCRAMLVNKENALAAMETFAKQHLFIPSLVLLAERAINDKQALLAEQYLKLAYVNSTNKDEIKEITQLLVQCQQVSVEDIQQEKNIELTQRFGNQLACAKRARTPEFFYKLGEYILIKGKISGEVALTQAKPEAEAYFKEAYKLSVTAEQKGQYYNYSTSPSVQRHSWPKSPANEFAPVTTFYQNITAVDNNKNSAPLVVTEIKNSLTFSS